MVCTRNRTSATAPQGKISVQLISGWDTVMINVLFANNTKPGINLHLHLSGNANCNVNWRQKIISSQNCTAEGTSDRTKFKFLLTANT